MVRGRKNLPHSWFHIPGRRVRAEWQRLRRDEWLRLFQPSPSPNLHIFGGKRSEAV